MTVENVLVLVNSDDPPTVVSVDELPGLICSHPEEQRDEIQRTIDDIAQYGYAFGGIAPSPEDPDGIPTVMIDVGRLDGWTLFKRKQRSN